MHGILALLFQGFQLVYQDAFAIVKKASDEGAFSIVHTTGGYKS
jgi:hypothetical protein